MTMRFFPLPQPAPEEERVVVSINARVAGYVAVLLENVKYAPLWQGEQALRDGTAAISEFQADIMKGTPMNEMLAAIDRLYILLDNALNGTERTATQQPDGTYVYNPPITQGSTTNAAALSAVDGLRGDVRDMRGEVPDTWFGFPSSRPGTLADLLQAARINTAEEQGLIPNSIEDAVDLVVSGGGTVSSALASILGDTAAIATDGGLAIAQTSLLGLLATQIGALSLGIGQIRDAIVSGQQPAAPPLADSLAAISGNTASTVAALRALLGLEAVSDPIVGASLLVLAQCICERTTEIAGALSPEGDPDLNPEPESGCPGPLDELTFVRCDSVTFAHMTQDGQGAEYVLTYPGLADATGISVTSSGSITIYVVEDGYSLTYCQKWDFTGQDSWDLHRLQGESIQFVTTPTPMLGGQNPNSEFGGFQNTITASGGPVYVVFYQVLPADPSPQPTRNTWLTWLVEPNES